MAIVSSPGAVVLAAAAALTRQAHSFVVPPPSTIGSSKALPSSLAVSASRQSPRRPTETTSAPLLMSASATETSVLSLTLEKPLGLILEESEDGVGGVVVTQVNEGGSAYDSPSKDALIRSKISSVMSRDVSASSFDDVMDAIIEAPSPLEIEFAVVASPADATEDAAEGEGEEDDAIPTYEVGTSVTITVEQTAETNKPPIALEAKVGDNLRKTLLANGDIELYRGLKKKLGNCGGGGQCGWCAVELIDEEGVWGDRSDYEAQRIGKNGNERCRLACMNNIVGPATVKTL